MSQKSAAYDANGVITAFYDSVISPAPAGEAVIDISDEQWLAAISTHGYTVKDGVLIAPVPPTADELLAAAQAAQINLLSAACQAQIVAGFTSAALGSPHTYPASSLDQQNLSSSVLASLMPNLPANWTTVFWCEANGQWAFAAHTAAQIQQVGQDGMAAVLAAKTKNQQLAAQVLAATTIAAVQAIVWG